MSKSLGRLPTASTSRISSRAVSGPAAVSSRRPGQSKPVISRLDEANPDGQHCPGWDAHSVAGAGTAATLGSSVEELVVVVPVDQDRSVSALPRR